MVFIYMDSIEHDVKVLKKLLNSPLLLDKYPIIDRVWVDKLYGNKIDVVLGVKEPANEYWPIRDEIKSYIWNIAKMTGVKYNFAIYP